MRDGAYGIRPHDLPMIANLLEFRGRFRTFVSRQISKPAHVGRIKISEESAPASWDTEIESLGRFQPLKRVAGATPAEIIQRPQDREVIEPDQSIVRKAFFQVAG